MTQSSNYKAGEFSIDSISLINQYGESVDISKLVVSIRMFESIYNKFCTAEIGILDGLDLPKYYRMTGQESVRIAIRQKEGIGDTASDEFSIDKTFRLYKIENLQRPQESIQTYVMKLCDPRMLFSRRKRVSRTLRGSYDEMLQKVLLELGKFKTEEFDEWTKTSPTNYQFISPNWTVGTLIDYFTSSSAADGGDYINGMFFYQTLNGGFRFTDITQMFKREYPLSFSMKPRSATLDTDKQDINSPGGLNTQILHYEKPQLFNTLQGTVKGAYSSFMKAYDPIRKLNEDIKYDMQETFSRGKHLSGYPMILLDEDEKVMTSENPIDPKISPAVSEIDVDLAPNKELYSQVLYDINMVHSFDDASDISSDQVFRGIENKDAGVLERNAMMEILKQHTVLVTIPLRTDMSVGMVIQLDLPPAESNTGDATDKINDNRYLITDLSISANPLEYDGLCHLKCIKESFAKKISEQSPLDSSQDPERI